MANDPPLFTIVVNKSTLLSFLAFVGSAGIATIFAKMRRNEIEDTVTSSVSSSQGDDENNDTDDEDENEQQLCYLRRRLQHRLSFSNVTTAEDERTTPLKGGAAQVDSKVDFNPKNSNWHHFECSFVLHFR